VVTDRGGDTATGPGALRPVADPEIVPRGVAAPFAVGGKITTEPPNSFET
jgi:hypothetical protein